MTDPSDAQRQAALLDKIHLTLTQPEARVLESAFARSALRARRERRLKIAVLASLLAGDLGFVALVVLTVWRLT